MSATYLFYLFSLPDGSMKGILEVSCSITQEENGHGIERSVRSRVHGGMEVCTEELKARGGGSTVVRSNSAF